MGPQYIRIAGLIRNAQYLGFAEDCAGDVCLAAIATVLFLNLE
jgi:hypothetical protein